MVGVAQAGQDQATKPTQTLLSGRVDDPLPAWSQGRVTLIGDAASCVSLFGEGSSSAILGAATLADALAMTPHDIPAALTRYEATHRPASGRGQRAVPIISHLLIPALRAGITLRNHGLRLTGHR